MKNLKFLFSGVTFLFAFATVNAQKDSISILAEISADRRMVNVTEKIIFENKSNQPLQEVVLLNWIAAYKNRNSPLYHRKIEDRKSDLHFAKPEDLGQLLELQTGVNGKNFEKISNISTENISVPFFNPLNPGEKVKIDLQYVLQLPLDKFTGYGTGDKRIFLKYFFLVPDGFPQKGSPSKNYLDTEETATHDNYWNITIKTPGPLNIQSNLPEVQPAVFAGNLKIDPEILITEQKTSSISTKVGQHSVEVRFGYQITEDERRNLEFYLPLQLNFIQQKTGFIPEKIFISEKSKKKDDFFGNDDINFWKFRFQLFTPSENIDLDYFSIISQNVINQSISTYKEDDHWIKNGLKSYLEIQYLKTFYKNSKLLGTLPETKIFGIKPLKLFYASRLKLIDRYNIAYQYMMTQNLDQKIDEPFSKLSNFNEMVISKFETGMLLNYISEKTGTNKFESFLKQYFAQNNSQAVSGDDLLAKLSSATDGDSKFLTTLIEKKQRANFDLKKFERKGENLDVLVKKKAEESIPFKLDIYDSEGNPNSQWFDTSEGTAKNYFTVPDDNSRKIVINEGQIFPESNFRDNYLYTKGLFANTKKIRFKLIKDIPNPEYNEIYINPRASFNAYDKILLGLNFRNESLFDQKFSYSLTPYFSTGTGKITGSGGVSYSFLPPESFYRNLTLGASGSYFHYDYGLSYRKFSGYANMNFTKDPRSTIGRSASISYNHYDKDLTPEMMANNEYSKYNLWSVGYGYSDSRLIHEKYFSANLQGMEDFQKISAEAFYRYEFAQNKKIAFRLFAGYFFRNDTHDNIFDYGISRISNYSFSYGLLGQSATSGIFSQQFILAEGGFKSYIGSTVNQWITSFNMDSHVWEMFNVYADAGVYKNKFENPKFIWDSGIKVRVIPDFLEIYLPVYSSLGFEPSLPNYAKRIRYTLVLNLSAVINTVRRGWY